MGKAMKVKDWYRQRKYLFMVLCVVVIIAGISAGILLSNHGQVQSQVTKNKYDSGVFYEIFVRSFYDSDGDGIGDLNGVTEKLDYLQSLGISGIWLMPINPSPSYHGYDVTDYYDINPQYGTMEDFERLIQEAHKRNIKVIMDLVINHTSSQHPWFIESAEDPNSPKRNWYHWVDDIKEVNKISAIGGKAWHHKNGAYYLGIFWDGMPDLNLDNPEVRAEMIRVGQFWLKKGVDGFRLDAAKHIYEDFQGDNKQKDIAKKNVQWWQEFRKAMEEVNPDVYLVGEVWDSPTVGAQYLDHAFDAVFNFELATQLLNAARTERAFDIGLKLESIYDYFTERSGGYFEKDALFLTNHDQNRVMTELRGNINHAKMAAAVLLTLPGNPFIYYGEEIGMQGAKPDEYIREPMRWYAIDSDPSKLTGQTSWMGSRYNLMEGVSVEEQEKDTDSLLHHYRTLIHWRKQEPVLAEGGIEQYKIDSSHVISFIRNTETERVLVLHNLSGEIQTMHLDKALLNANKMQIILSTSKDVDLKGELITLPAYSSAVLKIYK